MSNEPNTPNETERLVFREWIPDDLPVFHSICSDPGVMKFVGDGETWTESQSHTFIDQAICASRTDGFCQWPLVLKSNRQLIGYCGLVKSSSGLEIGWRLAAEFWRQGLATEAVSSVLHYAEGTLRASRITATIQADNLPSIKLATGSGFEVESTLHRNGRNVLLLTRVTK